MRILVAVMLGLVVIVLCMASNDYIARATTFDSPFPPLCPPGVTQVGCLPWRPTPMPPQPKEREIKTLVAPPATLEPTPPFPRTWSARPLLHVDGARSLRGHRR